MEVRDALKENLLRDEITPEKRARTLFKLAALERWIERRKNEPDRRNPPV
jgi:hypothetical protein